MSIKLNSLHNSFLKENDVNCNNLNSNPEVKALYLKKRISISNEIIDTFVYRPYNILVVTCNEQLIIYRLNVEVELLKKIQVTSNKGDIKRTIILDFDNNIKIK